jgi:hypothetical protein
MARRPTTTTTPWVRLRYEENVFRSKQVKHVFEENFGGDPNSALLSSGPANPEETFYVAEIAFMGTVDGKPVRYVLDLHEYDDLEFEEIELVIIPKKHEEEEAE